jgi:hypothetical protein
MHEDINSYLGEDLAALQKFAITFAQLIAGLEMDPHGYFEKKYAARIERSESELEVRGVLTQLVQWAVSSEVTDAQRTTLDKELGSRGMPTVDILRANFLL